VRKLGKVAGYDRVVRSQIGKGSSKKVEKGSSKKVEKGGRVRSGK
jgi:hypothetical protein